MAQLLTVENRKWLRTLRGVRIHQPFSGAVYKLWRIMYSKFGGGEHWSFLARQACLLQRFVARDLSQFSAYSTMRGVSCLAHQLVQMRLPASSRWKLGKYGAASCALTRSCVAGRLNSHKAATILPSPGTYCQSASSRKAAIVCKTAREKLNMLFSSTTFVVPTN